jgi:hypothetical protein
MNELKWLSGHRRQAEKYSGKWVAILNDRIISYGSSAKYVLNDVKRQNIGSSLPLISKIPRKDEKLYIL